MANINLEVSAGQSKTITFQSAGKFTTEDVVFNVTGAAGSTTIAAGASGDTNQLTLSANTKYKLTSAGSTFVFTTPPDHTYNFSGVSFTSTNSTASDKNANNLTGNGTYYYSSNGPATSLGASTDDGGLYVQSYSSSWVGQIAQDYRNGRLFVRGKNNGTWSAWKRVANYDEVATSGHTHTTSIATSTGTNQITLAFGGKYAITAGGTSYVFTMPAQYSHPTSAGNKHIPSGGSSGQFLGWSASGTATWVNNPNTNDSVDQVDYTDSSYWHGIILSHENITDIDFGNNTLHNFHGEVGFSNKILLNPSSGAIVSMGGYYDANGNSVSYEGHTHDYSASNHTHTTTIATSSATNQITLAFGTKYAITAGGTSYVFTMPSNPNTNTTYTIATGDSNGQIKVTPSSGSAYNVSVKGLGSAAYTESTAYAAASHTHSGYLTSSSSLNAANLTGTIPSGCYTDTNNFGTVIVDTPGNFAAKVGIVNFPYALNTGNCFILYLKQNNTVANATLNIRDTGAKNVYLDGVKVTADNWKAGTYLFYYDGVGYHTFSKGPFLNTNTTYTITTGDSNGQIKVTPSDDSAYNVNVKGLGSAAYTASTAYASSSHSHGSITSGGAISSGTALANGDAIVFSDSSDGSKLKKSTITFDGSTTTKFLSQKGTWETPSGGGGSTVVGKTVVLSTNNQALITVNGSDSGNVKLPDNCPWMADTANHHDIIGGVTPIFRTNSTPIVVYNGNVGTFSNIQDVSGITTKFLFPHVGKSDSLFALPVVMDTHGHLFVLISDSLANDVFLNYSMSADANDLSGK